MEAYPFSLRHVPSALCDDCGDYSSRKPMVDDLLWQQLDSQEVVRLCLEMGSFCFDG